MTMALKQAAELVDTDMFIVIAGNSDIVEDFDITNEPICTYGDFPDIDTDFVDEIRDYLKKYK